VGELLDRQDRLVCQAGLETRADQLDRLAQGDDAMICTGSLKSEPRTIALGLSSSICMGLRRTPHISLRAIQAPTFANRLVRRLLRCVNGWVDSTTYVHNDTRTSVPEPNLVNATDIPSETDVAGNQAARMAAPLHLQLLVMILGIERVTHSRLSASAPKGK